MKVPFEDISALYTHHKKEIDAVLKPILLDGNFIGGNSVTDFEQQLAHYFNIKNCISCANGTDALQLAIMALDLPKGSKIIVPAFTYIAAVEVIVLLGYIPVFCDVDTATYNTSLDYIKAVYTKEVKAIILVHLFGDTCLTDEIQDFANENNIAIIEDNAQALGSITNYTNNKNIITCSFFPTKNLACFGDGGAILTNNTDLANKINAIAKHGQAIQKYQHEFVGINSRLDAIQATILNIQLNHLEDNIQLRRQKAEHYFNLLSDNTKIQLPQKNKEHTYNQYVIQVESKSRDALKNYLEQKEISTNIFYPIASYKQKAYLQNITLKNTEQLCSSVLALPMYPTLKDEQIAYICDNINDYYN